MLQWFLIKRILPIELIYVTLQVSFSSYPLQKSDEKLMLSEKKWISKWLTVWQPLYIFKDTVIIWCNIFYEYLQYCIRVKVTKMFILFSFFVFAIGIPSFSSDLLLCLSLNSFSLASVWKYWRPNIDYQNVFRCAQIN